MDCDSCARADSCSGTGSAPKWHLSAALAVAKSWGRAAPTLAASSLVSLRRLTDTKLHCYPGMSAPRKT